MKIAKYIPSPFSLALMLTVFTFLAAFAFTLKNEISYLQHASIILDYWYKGFWNLLEFGMQMALMLILGHVLALSKPLEKFINKIVAPIKNTSTAVVYISIFTLLMSFFNWGLGLIFGAIFSRKIGEHALENNLKINYPLVGAAGYSGLMVWHGGLSGSAPLAVAAENHFLIDKTGRISVDLTIFSTNNLICSMTLLIVIPVFFYLLSKSNRATEIPSDLKIHTAKKSDDLSFLDKTHYVGIIFGLVFLGLSFNVAFWALKSGSFLFINPNFINFLLFGLALLFHKNVSNFIAACEEAVGSSTGILIQFPLYAGIMGMMQYSGLITLISEGFIEISTSQTLPFFTFLSASIINLFIPSGGGQWAVQGPIIAQSFEALNLPFEKGVMALAYGDQLTNMLQPFWALPLLGITKLKAKDILPYSFMLMLLGFVVFSVFCFL